jgi:hypothetical protein
MMKTKGRLVFPAPDALDNPTNCEAPAKATAVQVRRVHRASHTATCLYHIPHPFTRVNRSASCRALEPRAATGTLPLDFHPSATTRATVDEDPFAAIPDARRTSAPQTGVPLGDAIDAMLGGCNGHARATTRQAFHDYLRRRSGARTPKKGEPKNWEPKKWEPKKGGPNE